MLSERRSHTVDCIGFFRASQNPWRLVGCDLFCCLENLSPVVSRALAYPTGSASTGKDNGSMASDRSMLLRLFECADN